MSNKLNTLIAEFAGVVSNANFGTTQYYIEEINTSIDDLIRNGQTWGKLAELPAEWFRIIFEMFDIQSPVTFYRPLISKIEYEVSIGLLILAVLWQTQNYKTGVYEIRRDAKIELNTLYNEISNILYDKFKGK